MQKRERERQIRVQSSPGNELPRMIYILQKSHFAKFENITIITHYSSTGYIWIGSITMNKSIFCQKKSVQTKGEERNGYKPREQVRPSTSQANLFPVVGQSVGRKMLIKLISCTLFPVLYQPTSCSTTEVAMYFSNTKPTSAVPNPLVRTH